MNQADFEELARMRIEDAQALRAAQRWAACHELTFLLKLTGFEAEWNELLRKNAALSAHWSLVKNWSEETRYDVSITRDMAEQMLKAVDDPNDGVFQCIRKIYRNAI